MDSEIPIIDESGAIVENPDLETGYIFTEYLDTDGAGTLELQRRVYRKYTPYQLEQIKEQKEQDNFNTFISNSIIPNLSTQDILSIEKYVPDFQKTQEYKKGYAFKKNNVIYHIV